MVMVCTSVANVKMDNGRIKMIRVTDAREAKDPTKFPVGATFTAKVNSKREDTTSGLFLKTFSAFVFLDDPIKTWEYTEDSLNIFSDVELVDVEIVIK